MRTLQLVRTQIYCSASKPGAQSATADGIVIAAKQISNKASLIATCPRSHSMRLHAYGVSPHTRRTVSISTCILEEAARPFTSVKRKENIQRTDVILDRSIVYPALPTENCSIPLSHIDNLMPDHDILACFVYAPLTGQTFQMVVSTLKTSLAKALVAYYPLAGRLVLKENEGPSLHCNDSGVEFEEASTDARFEDIDCFQPKCFDNFSPRKRVSFNGQLKQEEIPFSVKVTIFRCGGIVLGCRFHHRVVDTSAATQFLVTWSQISRGTEVLKNPFHHRSLVIKPRNPPQPSEAEQQHTEFPMPPPSANDPNVEVRSYYMSRQAIDELKRETQEDAYSSVTAFFWRASVRARKVDLQQKAHIYLIMNSRRVMGVPSRLFGNVLSCGVAESKVGGLLREPLGVAAGRVREALARLDKESLQSVVDMVETRRQRLLDNRTVLLPGLGREQQDSMLSSSMVSFPLYKINFGWGTPCFVTVNPSRRYHGFVYFVPPPPTWGGGLLANIECLSCNELDVDHELEALASSRPRMRSLDSMLT